MSYFKAEMHKIRFRPGLCPGPRMGSLRCSPRPSTQLGRGTPLPIPHPLDAFGVSVSTPQSIPGSAFSVIRPLVSINVSTEYE